MANALDFGSVAVRDIFRCAYLLHADWPPILKCFCRGSHEIERIVLVGICIGVNWRGIQIVASARANASI